MKKVVIISTFDVLFDRVKLLREYYESKNLDVTVITSDYSHRQKKKYTNENADIHIPVKAYKKNLSIDRLQSHMQFAKGAKSKVEELSPDIIHCIVPCNSLCQTMSEYKKTHKVKLIFDVNDLWPESLPVGNIKKLFPFTLWKNKRDKYIDSADMILSECNFFRQVLKTENKSKWHTLYFSKKEMPIKSTPKINVQTLNYCYLGSMNNIIDIDLIQQILIESSKLKPTTLHIIGGGEKKNDLINGLSSSSVKVVDHGFIYDQDKKQEIFDQCHYGLNIMKETVFVGLTMKSMDYMCGALPIINTIKGDTKKMCEEYGAGHNINKDNLLSVVSQISKETIQDNLIKRDAIKRMYIDNFSQAVFNQTLDGLDIV